jgi:hypothetical protein
MFHVFSCSNTEMTNIIIQCSRHHAIWIAPLLVDCCIKRCVGTLSRNWVASFYLRRDFEIIRLWLRIFAKLKTRVNVWTLVKLSVIWRIGAFSIHSVSSCTQRSGHRTVALLRCAKHWQAWSPNAWYNELYVYHQLILYL